MTAVAARKPRKTVARKKKASEAETHMFHRLLMLRSSGPLAVLEDIVRQVVAEDPKSVSPECAEVEAQWVRERADERIARWTDEAANYFPRWVIDPELLYPLLVESARAQTELPAIGAH